MTTSLDVKPDHTDIAVSIYILHTCVSTPPLNGIDVLDVGINKVDMPSSISQVSNNIYLSQLTDKMLH